MLFNYFYNTKDIFEKDFDNTLKINVLMTQSLPSKITSSTKLTPHLCSSKCQTPTTRRVPENLRTLDFIDFFLKNWEKKANSARKKSKKLKIKIPPPKSFLKYFSASTCQFS